MFNWLFARHHNGEFLLRIEDTDLKRSTQAAIDAILDGMNWLGLSPDQPEIYQSQRAPRHVEIAEELLARGKAFKCYVTPEELSARREEGQALLQQVKEGALEGGDLEAAKEKANRLLGAYRSPYRDGKAPASSDMPYTVRLKAPDEGHIVNEDLVQGTVSVRASEIDDLILLRADGTPTYMLAVVVDDHDMEITHIIRGDDHLTNTSRQIPIYQAMDWATPAFAHIPLIHGPDGAKLSKRHGALGVEAYRDMGYLPEGLKNYLLRLGWSHGDDEFITESDAIDWFGLEALNKGASRMDFEKLGHINAQHIKHLDTDRALTLVVEEISKTRTLSDDEKGRLQLALPVLLDRGQTIVDIAKAADFLLIERPIEISGKAKKKLKPDSVKLLGELKDDLEGLNAWTADALSEGITRFCEKHDISMGQIGPALRTSLTGGLPAPDLNLILFWLGKTESLARIDDVLAAMESNA